VSATQPAPLNRVTTSRNSYGCVRMTDPHSCYLCRESDADDPVRFNLDGIWTVLCVRCRRLIIEALTEVTP
jgi:hypothetical protein